MRETVESTRYSNQFDTYMSGIEESGNTSPDSPPQERSPTPDSTTSELQSPHDSRSPLGNDRENHSPSRKSPTVFPMKILTKGDDESVHATNIKLENESPRQKYINPDSETWLKSGHQTPETTPQKSDPDQYASDPRKLPFVTGLESPEHQDPTKV